MDTPTVISVVSLALTVIPLVLMGVLMARQGRQERSLEQVRRRLAAHEQRIEEDGADPDRNPRTPAHVAVVMNPSKHSDPAAFTERLHRALDVYGVGTVRVHETTEEDPGHGQTLQAIEEGAELVIAAGGDGTVRMVASALAGTDVRMGIIPVGTGNLLARNLELPLDSLDGQIAAALIGRERRVDVGWLRCGNSEEELESASRQIFLVISGIGADAEVIGATNSRMKKRIGWIAYVLAGMDKIVGHSYDVELTFDGDVVRTFKARTVLIGNVGKLPAGIVLMPEATIDNRQLEIMAMNWRGPAGLSQILTQMVNPRINARPRLSMVERRLTSTLKVVASRPQPVQLDGDPADEASHLLAEVDPGALIMRVADPR